MQKEHADLRTLIERRMTCHLLKKVCGVQHFGPFSKKVAEKMMYEVALGVHWLHQHNIVHRDLKASNVLVRKEQGQFYCFVADYECSVGVRGTGFFRAPEILQACKDKTLEQIPELFSKEADVYSYGMVCYEVLTGKLPFEGHEPYERDIVLKGKILEVPEYVDDWMRELLSQCWQSNPEDRPSFKEILNKFSTHSVADQCNSRSFEFEPYSLKHWNHPKTEAFTETELMRQFRRKVYCTAFTESELRRKCRARLYHTALVKSTRNEEPTDEELFSLLDEEVFSFLDETIENSKAPVSPRREETIKSTEHGEREEPFNSVGELIDNSRTHGSETDTSSTSSAFFSPRDEEMIKSTENGELAIELFSFLDAMIENSKAHGSETHTSSTFSAFSSARSGMTIASPENGERTTSIMGESSADVHWSEIADLDDDVEKLMEVDNMEVFKALQKHPKWGDFFRTFGRGAEDVGYMELGKKIGEGAQASLHEVHIKWHDFEYRDEVLEEGRDYVLKVFHKETLLRYLQPMWATGMLQWYAERRELMKSEIIPNRVKQRHTCDVVCGTLLEDFRFAFLLPREQEDLRALIDRRMLTTSKDCPFSEMFAKRIMHDVALGMDTLHSHDIVHRDLKASNVLIREDDGNYQCLVADFECSIGVIGTGFFRAPEILQACKERNISRRPELFSKKVDVYSYGMTCYEILTGKVPFEDRHPMEYDLVINGDRPHLPEYVDDWTRQLVLMCWQSDPVARPSFGEILNLFFAHLSR